MTDEEIERFIRLFEETSLPRSEWTHGKHLIVALVYLTRHPARRGDGADPARHPAVEPSLREFQRLPRDDHAGLDRRGLAVPWPRGRRSRSLSILSRELLEECEVKDYLLRYLLHGGLLMSDEARRIWVPPDRSPID